MLDDDLFVEVFVGDVESLCFRSGQPFRAEGAVLRGPLAKSYDETATFRNPTIHFNITTKQQHEEGDRLDRSPVMDEPLEQKMLALAADIAGRFE